MAIKDWYLGKPKPPRKTRLMVGGQLGPEFEIKQEGIIRSPLATVLAALLGFIGREWRWIITTAIAMAALFITLSTRKEFMEIKTAEPCAYDSQDHKEINKIK